VDGLGGGGTKLHDGYDGSEVLHLVISGASVRRLDA
jgi:hypothetical protein